ncbi:MAG: DUF2868 domain-containing protein [Desulforhopalus sp.]
METNRLYNQIIDLEYFCHQDSDVDDKTLHQRDRDIFLRNQENLGKKEEPTNRELIWLWLTERRKKNFPGAQQKSPGTIFGDVYLLAKNLCIITGVIAGLAGGFSFFTYSGTTPVNVFHFLLLFVLSQLTLVVFLIGACLLRPLLPTLQLPSFYSFIFRRILGRMVSFFHKQWLHTVAAEQRVSVNHAFGIFKARSTIYGSLFYWPLFALSQLFAIGFNIGLLAATLVKISTSDLAFGWQSTLQFSTEAIHRGVKFAATPWSWLISSGNSYPSLTEIEGSRIILKEGIYNLTTADLIAWWPFLVFCLLFYGFFLRVALFFAGNLMERSAFKNLRFDTPACLALVRRMQTPLVTTQAEPEPITAVPENYTVLKKQEPSLSVPNPLDQVVLIPDDIYTLCPAEQLAPMMESRGFAITNIYRFMASYDRDQQLKQLLADKNWGPREGIFILMEGWMVPLVDFISFLRELRKILPGTTLINLGLVGRPGASPFTPVTREDFAIWKKKIEAMGDPYIDIFSLIS